ncbi:MAG: GNAT family N-acetyltransferase [Bacillota bacterium]|nr:GNAT family N-acetyltransferase [Bacillota bacterium]
MTDKDGNIRDECSGMSLNIFHIERFYIEEEFRNKGIGEKILDLLDDILNYTLNCEVGCYILLPNPITKNDKNELKIIKDENLNKKLKKKLVKFYRKCGYKKISKSDYMYLNTDYINVKRDFDVL